MNRYGWLAQRHWQEVDPARYATIPEPEDFFTTLGQEAESAVQELAGRLAGRDEPGEGYLAKVGRLNMARLQAEEQVLAEMVLIAASEAPEALADEVDGLDVVMRAQAAMDRARREAAEEG